MNRRISGVVKGNLPRFLVVVWIILYDKNNGPISNELSQSYTSICRVVQTEKGNLKKD